MSRARLPRGHLALRGLCLAACLVAGCRAGASRREALLADGLDRLARGDSSGAEKQLLAAEHAKPGDARVLLHLGQLQARGGSVEARARAEKSLRRAVQLAPRDGACRAALGELLAVQQFHRESIVELRQAVRLDPRQARAWFRLGLELQRDDSGETGAPGRYDSVLACFQHAFELDPSNSEARYRVAFLALERGELERARELVQPFAYGRDRPGRFGLLLCAIEFRARRFEAAQGVFERTLAGMLPAERLATIGLAHVVPPDSALDMRLQSDAERDSLATIFWWGQDPTPTTEVNERLLEHVTRLLQSDFYFEVPRLHLAGRDTDRGDVWVRYGPPQRATPIAEYDVPAWRWTYRGRSQESQFVFLDEYFNGNYRRPRRRAGSDFMRKEVFDEQPQLTSLHFQAPPPGAWRYRLRQFRGDAGRTALEVGYEVALEARGAAVQLEAAGWRGPRQLAGRRRSRATAQSMYRLADGRRAGRMRFELPPGRLEIGLEATAVGDAEGSPPGALWIAMARDTVRLRRFEPERLGLSDLMLAHDVHDGDGGLFDMGGVIVVPRVESRVSEKLHLYFEIYPPKAARAQRRALAVTYRVQLVPPRTWSFWQQFRNVPGRDPGQRARIEETFLLQPRAEIEREKLTLDLRNLVAGDYTLTVEVRDTAGGDPEVQRLDFALARPEQAQR